MKLKTSIQNILIRSWWVMATLICSVMIYEQGLKKRDFLYRQLSEKVVLLQKEKEAALQKQLNLKLQINSQSDLAWVELTLMKGLGLVPEGQQKVYFYKNENEIP